VVTFAWVFFRSDSFDYAIRYLQTLVIPPAAPRLGFWGAVDHETLIVFALGCLLATPVVATPVEAALRGARGRAQLALGACAVPAVLLAIFSACTVKLAAGTYNPFIYFRF
jgi:alginate O-acetyltransferase complex protein AlgI